MLAAGKRGPPTPTDAEVLVHPAREPLAPLSVAILCGGASRRMGADKALLAIQPGTPPMLGLVIDRVRGLADDLFLVGVARPGYDRFGLPLVEDRYPAAGPLGGIATALLASKHPHCLVVACDMPFLNPDLLAAMAAVPRDGYDVLVPVVPEAAHQGSTRLVRQPLHAIYSRSCRTAIERRLRAGERRVTDFYADVRVTTFTQERLGAVERYRRSFFSADTPQAVAQARAWLLEEIAGRQSNLLY